VRLTRRPGAALLTYLPAVLLFAGMRLAVSLSMPGLIDRDATLLVQAAENVRNPVFVLLVIYFLATVFGGVSLAIVVAGRRAWSVLRREPEWAAFLVAVIPVTLLTHDIWRYLMYLAPVAVVLFATLWEATTPGRRRAVGVAVTAATLLTQRPWDTMNEFVYFRDWFPFYSELELLPSNITLELWPLWAWRVVFGAFAAWVLYELLARGSDERSSRGSAVRGATVVSIALALASSTLVLQWIPSPEAVRLFLLALAFAYAGFQLTGSAWGIVASLAFTWSIAPAPQGWPALTLAAAGLPLARCYIERTAPARTLAAPAFVLLAAGVALPVAAIYALIFLLAALVLAREWPAERLAISVVVLVAAVVAAGAWYRPELREGGPIWRSGAILTVNPAAVAFRVANVRWHAEVDPVTRAALERQYGVEPAGPPDGSTWHYRFGGSSRVADILADPRVEDTFYFERLDWRWRLSVLTGIPAVSRLAPGPGIDLGALAGAWLRVTVWLVPLSLALFAARGLLTGGARSQPFFFVAMALVSALAGLAFNAGAISAGAAPLLALLSAMAAMVASAPRARTLAAAGVRFGLGLLLFLTAAFAAVGGQFAVKLR
jgi:hypothetical protein